MVKDVPPPPVWVSSSGTSEVTAATLCQSKKQRLQIPSILPIISTMPVNMMVGCVLQFDAPRCGGGVNASQR